MVLCPGAPGGSSSVVLILKRLRRRYHGLKSHLAYRNCLWPCSLAITSTDRWVYGFYVQEYPKAHRQWFWF